MNRLGERREFVQAVQAQAQEISVSADDIDRRLASLEQRIKQDHPLPLVQSLLDEQVIHHAHIVYTLHVYS
jgi:hypothetical protein